MAPLRLPLLSTSLNKGSPGGVVPVGSSARSRPRTRRGPQCFVGGEPPGERAGGLGRGRGGSSTSASVVGLAGAQVGAEYGGLGGHGGAYRLDHGGIGERVRRQYAPRLGRAAPTVSSYGTGPARSRTTVSAFSCAAACKAWCRGTATGRAAGSQRASDSVEVKAGRAVRWPALGWAPPCRWSSGRTQPVLVLLDLTEDGHDGHEEAGQPLSASRTGPAGGAVLGQAASAAQPGIGGAVVVGEAGVGNVLVRHGPRPYRGDAAGLLRALKPGVDSFHRILSFR